ncbi:MAG: efflux RND transporter periplasmic adaptor subunit [Rhodothermia bacterium]|nr:MAG: efflux RND transporter periplasmic adaptor subunit [Rhodothermia bacterium]
MMTEIAAAPTKARIPIWILILIPVMLAGAFYVGKDVGAGDSPLEGSDTDPETAASHEEAAPDGISLSEQAKINIGLVTADAAFRRVEQVIRVPGTVKAHPNRVAYVNTRIEGRVSKLLADLGDLVSEGQTLAEIESRRFGNPIPLVSAVAPISGTIVERDAFLGTSVDPSTPLFKIIDLSSVIVEGDVVEDYVSALKMGQLARLYLNAYPKETFKGRIVFIGSTLDPDKRSLHIWIQVNNEHGKLKPEMFAEMAIVVDANPQAITVPVEAVIEDGPDKFVFVENGDSYQKVDVITGLRDDVNIEITDGLYPGDLVVIQGNHQLLAVATRPQAGGVLEESQPHNH